MRTDPDEASSVRRVKHRTETHSRRVMVTRPARRLRRGRDAAAGTIWRRV